MITTESLVEPLASNAEKVTGAISSFPADYFNEQPTPDQWSAGDIAEHLVKIDGYANRILIGSTEETNRDPQKKISTIQSAFEDQQTSYTAGGPIQPGEYDKSQKDITSQLKNIREQMINILNKYSPDQLTETCLDFEHALFGYMTRIEWVWYTIFHSNRHLHQLELLKDSFTD